MTAVKVKAAQENRKLKDIIAESLRRDLGIMEERTRRNVRDIKPVSAGKILELEPENSLEGMLDARGHRY